MRRRTRAEDLDQELPDGKATTLVEVQPYSYNITDEACEHAITLDHGYEATVTLPSDGEGEVTFGEAAYVWPGSPPASEQVGDAG